MKKNSRGGMVVWWLVIWLWLMGGGGMVRAQSNDKYVTIVNPMRSRELWKDKGLETIDKQYRLVEGLVATWLVQYDVLADKELVGYLKTWESNQEMGVFLEVSRMLADEAGVPREINRPWYDPGIVFLSAYERSERKKLIDKLFESFKSVFGDYPRSVGAWWIDSFSLRYMREKYGVEVAMIVADQKTTDSYGVWGQWWSIPYRVSEYNPQVPAKDGLPVIQWAMRDPVRAFVGEGYRVSNFSMQANDYVSQGLDFNYFKQLAKTYVETENEINQITIGLEVGQEATGNLDELKKQIDWLKTEGVEAVTMSRFGKEMRTNYNGQAKIDSFVMTTEKRINDRFDEKIDYSNKVAWSDEFVADKSTFLDRNLNNLKSKNINYIPYWIGVMIITGLAVGWKWGWRKALTGPLMTLLLWWPIWRSGGQWGWWVFYGPKVEGLIVAQILLAVVGVITLSRVKIDTILVLGLGTILNYARLTVIEGRVHAGFLMDNFRLVGWNSRQFEGWVVNSMLKFKWEWVWNDGWVWLLGYPLVVIILGKIVDRLPVKIGLGVRIVLGILLVIYVRDLLLADPAAVVGGR